MSDHSWGRDFMGVIVVVCSCYECDHNHSSRSDESEKSKSASPSDSSCSKGRDSSDRACFWAAIAGIRREDRNCDCLCLTVQFLN